MTDNLNPLTRDMQLVSNDALSGLALFDRAGDKLGVIKDVYLDKVTGQVEFVVGATGVASFTKRELQEAPAYDRDQLSSTHYGWGESVRRYFSGLGHPA